MKNNSSFRRDLWVKNGSDYHCSLKEMKDAIVVAYYLDSTAPYGISTRSYFPFKNDIYNQRFDKAEDAIKLAEEIVFKWVQSLFEIPEPNTILIGNANQLEKSDK